MATKLTIYLRSGREVIIPLQQNNQDAGSFARDLTNTINTMKSKSGEVALRFGTKVFVAENIEFIDVE